MSTHRSRPRPDVASGWPHGDAREKRQPYAAEHEDYIDGVAKPPEQGGKTPAYKIFVDGTTNNMRPERR